MVIILRKRKVIIKEKRPDEDTQIEAMTMLLKALEQNYTEEFNHNRIKIRKSKTKDWGIYAVIK